MRRNDLCSFVVRSGRLALALLLAAVMAPAWADGGVTFTDVADGGGAGITFHRTPSAREAIRQDILFNATPLTFPQFALARANSPQKSRGAPGVALFDYDRDGDLDIYVTNGPGSDNSLYSNQLTESGELSFVDVAAAAGVAATSQDSTGVCYGDIDNDGDEDLYVLATAEAARLFQNNGDGTFTDITAAAGAGGPQPYRHSVACTMADFTGDGLLDVVVANTYRGCSDPVNPFTGVPYPCSYDGNPAGPPQNGWDQRIPIFSSAFPIYPEMEHNVLLVNQGGNQFADASAASGIEDVSGMSGPGLSGAAFTWAITSYDIDLDGDVDIHSADNQGSASVPIGWHRIFANDGSGNFTDVTAALNLDDAGGWMGVAPADFNCDGRLDFFSTNLGAYVGGPNFSSRWYLQQADGTFVAPGVGALGGTPFGWGTSSIDYDNDGDYDVIYHGSVNLFNFVIADNPGVLLTNQGDCSAVFDWDQGAVLKDHRFRTVEGVATGDLNQDGFSDVVSVSSFDITPGHPGFRPITLIGGNQGVFDSVGAFQNELTFGIVPGMAVPVVPFPDLPDGTLAVELNSADNGNNWVQFDTLGSAGILVGGTVNRDGIGATLSFTPDGGKTSLAPVLGGSSYASQNSLTQGFGLGDAVSGTAEVLWPGGVRNRLYDVEAGERVLLPHIPCSFDADWKNFGQYNACVMQALNGYLAGGHITAAERNRLRDSARRAFHDAQ